MTSQKKLSRRDFLRATSVTLAGAALTACSPAAQPAVEKAKDEPTTAPAVAEQVKLTLSSWWNKPFKDEMEKFNAKYPNIQVEIIDEEFGAHHDKVMTALVSGSGAPDIVGIEDARLLLFAGTGGLADLSNHLMPYKEKLVKYKLELGAYQGKYYSVPWDGSPCLLYYRRDICEQYQIDPEKITTYEDWYQVGVTLKEASDGKVRLWGIGKDNPFPLINWTWQQGGGLYSADESKTIIDNDIAVKTLTFIKKLWDGEVVHQNLDANAQNVSYKDGTSAVFPGAIWLAGVIEGVGPETSGKWGVVRVPAWESGGSRVFTYGGSQLAITAQSKNVDASFKFLEYFQLTQAGQEIEWLAGNLFPVLVDAKNWPIMAEPAKFYGGQAALRMYAEANAEVVPYTYGKGYLEASQIVGLQQAEVMDGRKSPEQALKDAAKEIREKQNLD